MSDNQAVQRTRLLMAVAIVAVLVTAAPVIEGAGRFASGEETTAAETGGIDADALIGMGDAFDSLERIEEAASVSAGAPPEAFKAEVGFLPAARDIRVSNDGAVVGYVVDGDAESVFEQVQDDLQGKGWTAVPLGEGIGATFIKEDGACTWVLCTCTQTGAATSVVLRSVIA